MAIKISVIRDVSRGPETIVTIHPARTERATMMRVRSAMREYAHRYLNAHEWVSKPGELFGGYWRDPRSGDCIVAS